MLSKIVIFFESNLLLAFVTLLGILFWVTKYVGARKARSDVQKNSTYSTLWNFIFRPHKVLKFKIPFSIYKKSKGKKIPTISSWGIWWNLCFCPHKVQDTDILCGSIINQIILGICALNVKEKIAKITGNGLNYILFFHPEALEELLRSNIIVNKNSTLDIVIPWLGDSILTSADDDWRRRRKLIMSTLHIRILQGFQNMFYEHSNTLVEKLKEEMKNEIFDITEIIKLCTLDIIADATLGVPINAQAGAGKSYLHAIEGITAFVLQWNLKPWYWFSPIRNLFNAGKKFKSDIKIVHRFDKQIIERKKKELMKNEKIESINDILEENEHEISNKKRSLLELLLYYHIQEKSISEEDVRGEMENIIFAGHDSAAITVSWALYHLGLHQDMQEKVFHELQEIFDDEFYRKITTNDLKRMTYLERVIKETLRINPPIPIIVRRNPFEMKVGEYVLPRNSQYVIAINALHHNPTVYENPEEFDPDRFLPENCEKRHPFAFIPFSAGPRNCLGQRFAMMEMKTILANVVRNFKVKSIDPLDKIFISTEVVLRPKFGLRMNFQKR